MVQTNNKGFTLIELLVVIAIVGVLAAVVLLAINPVELLKRGRDSTRFQDVTNLRKAIDASMASDTAAALPTCAPCVSAGANRSSAGGGWFGYNLSAFLPSLPVDPRNALGGSNSNGTTVTPGAATGFRYEIGTTTAGMYEIRTMLESTTNNTKSADTADGGDDGADWYEAGTLLTVL